MHPVIALDKQLGRRITHNLELSIGGAANGGQYRALVSRVICRFTTLLVASPGYLARRGIPRSASDLDRHEHLAARFPTGGISNWRFAGTNGDFEERVPAAVITLSDPVAP